MPERDFKCVICQADCGVGPVDADDWCFCESCCPDHVYEYDSYERQHVCVECGQPAPEDFYYSDDDHVPMSFSGSAPVGIPLSQVTGAQLDAMAASWRGDP